ncbi:MAG: zinc-ribbon domain-containing protein, partial [Thermoplasmata archaeon]|nr:zinc-ribbon domain-containing protein [Thermoplasmata archaeon]
MSVCLHCGQLAPDAALFCPKCGFTLPQGGSPPSPWVTPAGAGLGVPPGPVGSVGNPSRAP